MKISFCQPTFKRDWNRTIKHIENWLPYVDYIIIVVDETISSKEIKNVKKKFSSEKLKIIHTKFEDNIPEYRNKYVELAKKLQINWIVVSDPDEWINLNLRKDIYKICQWADENGYTQLGINCHERFETVEWLPFDKLDELKEYPGGYRESNYYKFLINKICCDKFKYTGVGITRSVHETWGCPIHKQRGIYLPKDRYWYEHVKSAYDIWRNAARNLFIGGGGDNVGELNEMWIELRKICDECNIKSWREFEDYVINTKTISPKLLDWIKKALDWKATDYGVETRETAKWIIFHHRYLLDDPEIKYKVEHPPKLTKEDEIETYVRRCYFQFLGRHPDRGGLEYYKRLILEGRIRREDLPKMLMSSPEYREKFALEREGVRLQVPVNVDIQLTDEIIIQALMRSDKWFSNIKPTLDVGKFILDNIRDKEEFLKWFYKEKYNIKLKDIQKWLK